MARKDSHEIGIALGRQYCERMANRPQCEAGDPPLEPKSERRGHRPV